MTQPEPVTPPDSSAAEASLRDTSRTVTLVLGIAAVLYIALYVAFWPRIYSTMDEASYVGNAYVLRQGTVFSDVAGVFVATNFPVNGHEVSKYPLGMASVIALLSLFGWQFALGVNLLLHLLTFLVTIRILRFLQLPPIFALLYLLHPTAVLYSRTAMSDPASGLMIALAFEATLRRRWAGAGWWAGLSVLFRTGNVFCLPIFFLGAVLAEKIADAGETALSERLRNGGRFIAGAIGPMAVAVYYAAVIAGGAMGQNTGSFALRYFGEMFPAYVLMLSIIYPGMLFAPLVYRGPGKGIIVGLCYSLLLLYSFWFYRDKGSSAIQGFIMGQRYFLAVMPLFIVAYAEVVWRLLGTRLPRLAGIVLASGSGLLLFAMAGGIHVQHSRFLGTMAEIRDTLLRVTGPEDRIFCNLQLGKLIHPAWGVRQVRIVESRADARKSREELVRWSETPSENSTTESAFQRAVLAFWFRTERLEDRQTAQEIAPTDAGISTETPPQPLPPELSVQFVHRNGARLPDAPNPSNKGEGEPTTAKQTGTFAEPVRPLAVP